ncbi:MAG: ABC transporter permease [Phycisphaerales bacterium]|nr:ABC transporter permease [Phycisphaerales bacterium]
MMRMIARRLVLGAATLACVYALTFLMVVSAPGNPLQTSERNLAPEVAAALRARYDMDHNGRYFVQLLLGILRLDFGPTFQYPDWTCNQILAQSLPVSAMLGLVAILLAVVVGVPLGAMSAVRGRGWASGLGLSLALAGVCVPTFVTGSCLLLVFAVFLRVAPVGGWGTLAHLPLPAVTLALPFVAYVTRLTRAGMTEALSQDYIRTALAKGLPRRQVVWKHAFPVAFLPVLTYLGPATAQAMTGSFVVEKVFSVPGMGQHFVNAALNRDPGLLIATVLVFSAMVIAFNLIVDGVHVCVDPRLRSRAA